MICFWHGRARADGPESGLSGETFRDSVAEVCRKNLRRFEGPVSVRLFMVLNARTEAHSMIKPCLEALELAGVIVSGRQVRHFSFYRETAASREPDSIGIAVTAVKQGQGNRGQAGLSVADRCGVHRPLRAGRPRRQVPAHVPFLETS